MCNWVEISKQKPKPGQRFIGTCGKKWNLFTAPAHDLKEIDGDGNEVVVMTKEQHLDKILSVYAITRWMVPDV